MPYNYGFSSTQLALSYLGSRQAKIDAKNNVKRVVLDGKWLNNSTSKSASSTSIEVIQHGRNNKYIQDHYDHQIRVNTQKFAEDLRQELYELAYKNVHAIPYHYNIYALY